MAGGYTLYRPDEDSSFTSKTEMLERIISLMGGRVAEKIIGDDISTGPSSDISRASDIARGMVTRYGMSEKLGPVVYGKDNDQVFLGMDYNHTKNYSDSYATQIDDEIKSILLDCEKKCRDILEEHNDKLVLVAETLIEKEKIDRALFLKMMSDDFSPEEEVTSEEKNTSEEEIISDEITTAPSEETEARNVDSETTSPKEDNEDTLE